MESDILLPSYYQNSNVFFAISMIIGTLLSLLFLYLIKKPKKVENQVIVVDKWYEKIVEEKKAKEYYFK